MDYIAVWEDGRNGSSTDIYASRINNDGTVLDSSGIAVTTASGAQYEPDLACDGTDCLIAWHDFRSGSSYDIYGARLGGDGSVLDPSGIAVSTAAGHEYNPAVGFDGSNYFVAWQGDPNGQSYGIYGSRVTTGGTVLDPSAITISSAAYHKVKPALSFNGTNYLVAWEECRNEFYTDIYGIRMSGDGTLLDPTDQLLLANGNPFSLAFDGNYHRLVAWKYADGGTRFEAAGTWVHPSGVPMDGAGSSLLAENDTVEGIDIAAAGDNSALLAYSRYDDDPEINGTAVFGRVLLDHFQSKSVTRLAGGEVQIDWQTNPDVTEATGVNIYSSRSFDENYDRLNVAPLPLTGSYVDDSQRAGVPNYYWLELIFAGGTTSKERRDVEWITPEAVDTDFVVAVRESTVAAVPGGTSVYDVEVLSQKGYTGTVDLTAVGLPAAAVSAVFDPASVEVPGHSTLTVNWDPLLAPPTGGYDYPFEITASESGGASLVIHTVDVTGVVIDPDDEYLTQFVYPAEPEAGHDAEVFGRLAPPQSGQAVTVTTGVSADVFTATTDAEGFFSQTVSVAAAGSVSFASSTAGASAAPYVTNARRGRRQIRMTATTADGLIDPSDLVEVDGEIDPVPGTGDVYVRITNPDGTSAHADYVTVDEYGTFHQSFYAQEGVTEVEAELPGDADYYNASARLNVPANAPIGMAIVVAAGGETDNPMWDATGVLTDRAYNVYKGRLIPEDRIRYLHPDASRDPDSDGTPEVAAAPTKAELQAAIETWASALVDVSVTSAPFKTPLTLYIAGVETSPSVIQLNETETLTAAELGTWLNAYLANVQDRYPDFCIPEIANCPPDSVPVNIVLEFGDSGAFVGDLAARDRIVVTSTGDVSSGYPGQNIVSPDGTLAFSRYFYDEINQGKYIATGWATGAEQMLYESLYSQWPLIEANGNGIPNEEIDQIGGDGAGDKVLEYRNTYERRPAIDAMFSGLTITPDDDGTGTLWAKILDYGEYIDRVKCVVLPPQDSGEPMREYRMQWNASRQRYELNHDGFRHRGLYKILITAVDEDEDAALPWLSLVDVRSDTAGDDTTPPEDVTDVYSRAEDGQVYLSWTESISSDVAGYYVYAKPAGGAYGTGVYAGNNDHYTVTGLTNGAAYVFKITAIDEVPNESAGVETGPVLPRGADFTADQTEVLPGSTVQFTDLSTGSPIACSWDFNGDLVEDSTAQHPSYLYTSHGTYTVTLTATYADGSDQEVKADYISVQGQVADFSAVPTHGTLPMSVQFTDESISETTIIAWSWDLDGDAVEDSTDQHPSYQYDAPGEYDVTFTVTTADGSDFETKAGYIVVACPTPDPAFTSDVSSGPAPLDVTFTSTTEAPATGCDPTAWSWTFGDSASGAGEIVSHTYSEDGLYDVCLTVTVPGTSAQTCVVDYIDVGGGCASGNLCLTLLLAGYWDGTEQSTEAYLTVDFYADPESSPSYRIANVQLDTDGTALIDLTAAGVLPGAYYVVARPLNHLDLMSEGALAVGGAAAAGLDADFSDPTQVACGEAALVFVGERWCAPGGDASGDGQVDLSDYSLLAQQWGLSGPEADFTGDAVVDLSDYANLAQGWSREMCEGVPGIDE